MRHHQITQNTWLISKYLCIFLSISGAILIIREQKIRHFIANVHSPCFRLFNSFKKPLLLMRDQLLLFTQIDKLANFIRSQYREVPVFFRIHTQN